MDVVLHSRTTSRHASGAHSCGIKRATSGITTNIISSVVSRDLGGDAGLQPSASSQLCKQPSTYLIMKKKKHINYNISIHLLKALNTYYTIELNNKTRLSVGTITTYIYI